MTHTQMLSVSNGDILRLTFSQKKKKQEFFFKAIAFGHNPNTSEVSAGNNK